MMMTSMTMSCAPVRSNAQVARKVGSIRVRGVARRSGSAMRAAGRQSVNAAAASDERQYIEKLPDSLLRPGQDDESSTKVRMERIIREGQTKICNAISEVDGVEFCQDAWLRKDGGGGITRVLGNGNVWEKAGIAVSVVYGTMPGEAYKAAKGTPMDIPKDAPPVSFFACGISSVMHPWNPHCPTMHFNYRYFQTEDWCGIPGQAWFGGGTDITPMYIDRDDMKHFHGTYKDICDKYNPEWYPRMKKWCDEYFTITHRGEARGLGGIFYDDFQEADDDTMLKFSEECLQGVIDAYVPIIKKHMNDEYTEQQKRWQQLRRGRYVEYNLIYDRGTIFGLKTGGRVESILMSMPLTARWEYDMQPEAGSPEAEIMECFRNNPDWV